MVVLMGANWNIIDGVVFSKVPDANHGLWRESRKLHQCVNLFLLIKLSTQYQTMYISSTPVLIYLKHQREFAQVLVVGQVFLLLERTIVRLHVGGCRSVTTLLSLLRSLHQNVDCLSQNIIAVSRRLGWLTESLCCWN